MQYPLKQSFGGSLNARSAIDQKVQAVNNDNTAKIKIGKIEI